LPARPVDERKVIPLSENFIVDMYTGVKLKFHAFLTSVLDGDEWSALFPGHLLA
jgi:hypothetical protein